MSEPNDPTTAWDALDAELEAWRASAAVATFWWRDDDATRPGGALDRLLATAPGLPLAVAVIPEPAENGLARRLAAEPQVAVVQHGYAHRNHAPAPAKKSEYGPDRPADDMLREVARGHAQLTSLFDGAVRPVFVPPWNRIDDAIAGRLGEVGFDAVSTFGPASGSSRPPRINAHVDIIDWTDSRGFAGETAALGAVVRHLGGRRAGAVRHSEATGLLTHHLAHDEPAWRFLDRLFARLDSHRAVRWLDIDALLEITP